MKTQAISNPTNDAESAILTEAPYAVDVEVQLAAPFLFHRWSNESVAAKSAAKKGSKAKKEDDLESYVYRLPDNSLAIPTEYFRMSLVHAAKYKQDPRSPRKSAMDLFKAGVVGLTDLNPLGQTDWDFLDRRRVIIQRNAITRVRPGIAQGKKIGFQLQVLTPEYISPELLNETLQSAGRLVGVGDFRPTFGRFQVTSFKIL